VVLALVISGLQRGKRFVEKLVQFLVVLRRVRLEFTAEVGWDFEVERRGPRRKRLGFFALTLERGELRASDA
jgi:hypothetical protein